MVTSKPHMVGQGKQPLWLPQARWHISHPPGWPRFTALQWGHKQLSCYSQMSSEAGSTYLKPEQTQNWGQALWNQRDVTLRVNRKVLARASLMAKKCRGRKGK